jgi:hypothetical protein
LPSLDECQVRSRRIEAKLPRVKNANPLHAAGPCSMKPSQQVGSAFEQEFAFSRLSPVAVGAITARNAERYSFKVGLSRNVRQNNDRTTGRAIYPGDNYTVKKESRTEVLRFSQTFSECRVVGTLHVIHDQRVERTSLTLKVAAALFQLPTKPID